MPTKVFDAINKIVNYTKKAYKTAEKVVKTAEKIKEGKWNDVLIDNLDILKIDKNFTKMAKTGLSIVSDPETWKNFKNNWHKSIAKVGLAYGEGFMKSDMKGWKQIETVLTYAKKMPNLNNINIDTLLDAAIAKALEVCTCFVL